MKTPAVCMLALAALLAGAPVAAAAEHVPASNPSDYPDVEHAPAQRIAHQGRLDVDVWINKDEGGVYRPGESMRVYFRSTGDGYVLVFNVDTEGYIHLIYPYGPNDPPFVDGGRAYRIPSRSDPYDLVADGPQGIEYVVAVASPVPFQDLPWYLSADRADGGRPDLEDGDDDTGSGQIEGDPYVGIDRIIRRIAPQGREDRIATNETYFYIGQRVEYPRYVCADCHYHPFYFDPYVNACSAFEIRVDATWAHYAPIRYGTVRPRYIYRVRPQAPTRYRQWKSQWSSLDGRTMLRTRFLPERDVRYRREQAPRTRTERPEVRDLRRYREGRIWRGRDEILRLREQRDRVGAPPDNRGRVRSERPPDGGGWRDRGGHAAPPDARGYRQRGERRRPDDGSNRRPDDGSNRRPPGDRGVRERERPQPRDDQGSRPREDRRERERPQPSEDRGNRERAQPREEKQREERPQRDDRREQQRDDSREQRDDRSNQQRDRGR